MIYIKLFSDTTSILAGLYFVSFWTLLWSHLWLHWLTGSFISGLWVTDLRWGHKIILVFLPFLHLLSSIIDDGKRNCSWIKYSLTVCLNYKSNQNMTFLSVLNLREFSFLLNSRNFQKYLLSLYKFLGVAILLASRRGTQDARCKKSNV